ncbi:hypothetical protein [Streptomyces sp. RKAG337]|uniref:hypothetical protein n=1 Tax=Streptomyces sp. RKAG337 TaxID=2893404 RepID=UPI0020349FAE|nr:hypothetical protein [Streptomyces sp. RKAG337]MCM2426994.1 hypothetical protein [Streptomyces sp. RKAG337]
MTIRTLTAGAALATVAALLLTACGGSSDKSSDKIPGVPSGGTASASPSTAEVAGRPTISLPADLKLVFEGSRTGDPIKDAVLSDSEQRIRAVDEAISKGELSSPAVAFYSKPMTQISAHKSVQAHVDAKATVTGTFRYYHQTVKILKPDTASLTYCADESRGFGKSLVTGKVLTTPVTKNSYVFYTTEFQKNSAGVWQASNILSTKGAGQCQP